MAPKPGWYSDPWGAHKLRRWDGSVWTPQVTDRGPIRESPIWEGGGTLLTEPVLVVHRWATGGSAAPTLSGSARIYGYRGRQLARAEEAVLSVAEQVFALSGGTGSEERWDVSAEERGPVLSASRTSLELRPVEFTFRRADGSEVGRLVQDLADDATFTAYGARDPIGVVRLRPAEGLWWTVRDTQGTLLATASPQDWAPTPSGERHVVEVPLRLPPDRAELVVAAAVAIHGEIVRALT
jgi:Protein of unknown function (DUF2510)